MNDPVERNEVIKAMKLKCFESTDSNGIEQYLFPLEDGSFIAIPKKRIENRQNGKWIDQGWHGDWQFETDGRGNCWHEYECSLCRYRKKGGRSNFCPHCGADMRGGEE